MKIIFFIIIYVLLYACQPVRKEKTDQSNLESTTKVDTIEIKTSKKSIVLSDFARNIEYISLSNGGEHPIGEISKIIFTEDHILVMDKKHTHTVFCFDHQGRFCFKIAKRGYGPMEYTKLSDMAFDKKSKQIIIYDRSRQSFLYYNMQGNFIKKEKTKLYIREFIRYKNNFVFYSQYSINKQLFKNKQSHLFFCDNNYKLRAMYLPFEEPKGYNGMYVARGICNNFSGDNQYFYHSGGNIIYNLESDNIKPCIYIDFTNKNVPKNYYYEKQPIEISDDQSKGKFILGLTDFQIAKQWLFGFYSYKEKGYCFIYNIKTKKKINGNTIFNDIDNIPQLSRFFSWEDKIVTVLSPYYISILKSKPGFTSNIKLPKQCENLQMNDNPVLQVITLK